MPEPAGDIPRAYPPQPRVGVGAVVLDPMHRILLVQRANPPAQHQWGLPGGLVQLGETLHDALHREIREECGIAIRIADFIGLYEPIIRDQEDRVAYHYVVVDYLCHWVQGDLQPGDDAQAVAWASPRNLERYELAAAARQMIAAARTLSARQAPA